MTAAILVLLKGSILLGVFAIGLKASVTDATFLWRRPGHGLRALLSMNLLMPLVALAVAAPFDLHPAVKIALVVLSVSPTPPIFPKKALKAGGTEAYTIGLLVTTAALSIVVIPLSMEGFERVTGVPLVMRAGAVATLVLTTILAPLLVGIAVRAVAAASAERMAGPISVVATVLLMVAAVPIVIGLAGTVVSVMTAGTVLSLTVFALVGLVVGHLLGGPEFDNRPVLALATASRHPAVALAIAHENFPNQRLVAPEVALY
jgi:BASS family bile acid:Na+ symporter